MENYTQKLKKYIKTNNIACELLEFTTSCHSVEDAAKTVNATAEDFVKNVCAITTENQFIVCVIKGENKLDFKKVKIVLNTKEVRMATPEEVLKNTGYPIGGVPSFGYAKMIYIDQNVMKKELVYSGGGSDKVLVKISSKEILRITQGKIAEIVR